MRRTISSARPATARRPPAAAHRRDRTPSAWSLATAGRSSCSARRRGESSLYLVRIGVRGRGRLRVRVRVNVRVRLRVRGRLRVRVRVRIRVRVRVVCKKKPPVLKAR